MNKLMALDSLGVAALLGVIATFSVPPAMADMVSYTTSLQSGNMCSGCGPFGTVTVTGVAGHSNEVDVSVTLASGEVYANTGAGSALLFDVSTNPTLSVSDLTSGFGFFQSSTHADGSGTWDTYIQCEVCGSGVSPPQDSGPVSFILSVSSGSLSPSSFVTNGNDYLFAADVGIPGRSGGFTTGDVVATGKLTPVPVPAAAWLLISGLGALGATLGRRHALRMPAGC